MCPLLDTRFEVWDSEGMRIAIPVPKVDVELNEYLTVNCL